MRQLLQASTIVVLPTQIVLSQLVHHSSALSKRHSLANYSILCVSDLIKALFFGSYDLRLKLSILNSQLLYVNLLGYMLSLLPFLLLMGEFFDQLLCFFL